MDEQDAAGSGAWWAARLGFALDTYVDRKLIGRPSLSDSNSQMYGQDEFGNTFVVGQQSGLARAAPAPRANPLMVLLLIGGIILLAKE
jgi:hypothetical protein